MDVWVRRKVGSWLIMLLIRNSLLYYSCQSRKTPGEAEKCSEETKRIEKLEDKNGKR